MLCYLEPATLKEPQHTPVSHIPQSHSPQMKEFPISHRQSRAIHIADVHRSARSAAARGTPHVESPKSTQIFFFDGKELPTPPFC